MSREILMVFLHYLIERSINMFTCPLIVLVPQDSNVTLYTQSLLTVLRVAYAIVQLLKFIEVMKLMYFLNLCRQSYLDVVGVLP